jgi:hypothetical protein
MKHKFEIDLVYLWVDGSDPVWEARKNAFLGKANVESDVNCKGRYANNDELKYSLRSAENHAPWIRKIFIVTDNQIPEWLDVANPRIKIINHSEILPSQALPCYNAGVIECFLYKIPDLSEHFLYSNDDMFFNADMQPDSFFADDGYPIVRLEKKMFGKWRYIWKKLAKKPMSVYRLAVVRASTLVGEKFGKYYFGIPHHNIDAYRKSDYQAAVEQVFAEEVKTTIPNHLRTPLDVQRAAFLYYALAIQHGHLRYISKRESNLIKLYKPDYTHYFNDNTKFFCMNDDEKVTDNDRARAKLFLATRFPVKSVFEK